jgi:hypothetical protein
MGFVGWGSLAAQALFGLVNFPIEQKWADSIEEGRAAKNRLSCSVRVISGTHPPLSGMWWAGTATLGPGTIVLTKKMSVNVLEVDRSQLRRPKVWEQYGVDLQSEIVQIRTESAVLEWSMRPKFLDWAIGRVSQAV